MRARSSTQYELLNELQSRLYSEMFETSSNQLAISQLPGKQTAQPVDFRVYNSFGSVFRQPDRPTRVLPSAVHCDSVLNFRTVDASEFSAASLAPDFQQSTAHFTKSSPE